MRAGEAAAPLAGSGLWSTARVGQHGMYTIKYRRERPAKCCVFSSLKSCGIELSSEGNCGCFENYVGNKIRNIVNLCSQCFFFNLTKIKSQFSILSPAVLVLHQ